MMCSSLFAQCFQEDSIPPAQQMGGGTLYESRHGRFMTASGTVRALVVLVELEYHPDSTHLDPQPNGNDSWPVHGMPDWVDNPDPTKNLLDHEEPMGDPQGMMTRYLYEASSGNFVLIADYLLAPDNGGIFSVPTTTGNVFGTIGSAVCPQALPVLPCCEGLAGFLHAPQLFLGKYGSVHQQLSQTFLTFRGLAGRLPFKHGLCFPPLHGRQLRQRPQQLLERYVELDLHGVKLTKLLSYGFKPPSFHANVQARVMLRAGWARAESIAPEWRLSNGPRLMTQAGLKA